MRLFGREEDTIKEVEREVIAQRRGQTKTYNPGSTESLGDRNPITAPATDAAQLWDGWGTALKPAVEEWIVAMKPRQGTFAQNALDWGVAGLNIDGCRIAVSAEDAWQMERVNTPESARLNKSQSLYGQAAIDHGAYNTTQGRWPANLVLSHSPGCECVGEKRVKGAGWTDNDTERPFRAMYDGGWQVRKDGHYTDPDGYETVEDWECTDDCAVAMLDRESGELPGGGPSTKPNGYISNGIYHDYGSQETKYHHPKGGPASRFSDSNIRRRRPDVKEI